MKKIVLSLISVISLASCSGTMTEKEIDAEMSSGIVLILNTSYYELKLSNGTSWYFTSIDEETGELENLAFSTDDIKVSRSTGTGFFISDDGMIATNNHVVAGEVTEKDAKRNLKSVLKQLKTSAATKYNQLKEYNEQLLEKMQYKASYGYDYSSEYAESSKVTSAMKEYVAIYNNVADIDVSDTELIPRNFISVAYNDTYVSGYSDFIDCVVKDTDPEHDVAIIQLKDKRTPDGRYVFDVPEEDMLETYSFMDKIGTDKNDKFVMLAFNYGTGLAFTKDGIRAQCTSGQLSQEDREKIMYTIPSLQGSSGAPVVNLKGELVAVNFAGISVTQNFNYGMKAKYLYQLKERILNR